MKKILFASAFALIGTFALANENTKTTEEKNVETKSKKVVEIEALAPCGTYLEIPACQTYWLCLDNYLEDNGSVNYGKLGQAITYFDDAKGC